MFTMDCLTLKVEAPCFSETLVGINQSTQPNIPEASSYHVYSGIAQASPHVMASQLHA
jgi:hypothetical protein